MRTSRCGMPSSHCGDTGLDKPTLSSRRTCSAPPRLVSPVRAHLVGPRRPAGHAVLLSHPRRAASCPMVSNRRWPFGRRARRRTDESRLFISSPTAERRATTSEAATARKHRRCRRGPREGLQAGNRKTGAACGTGAECGNDRNPLNVTAKLALLDLQVAA